MIESVSGWLMLGNPTEALNELRQLSSAASSRPDVLLLLWEIHAQGCRWLEAIEAADRVIAKTPDQPEGYIKRAFALHELRRTEEAWNTLEPVSARFDQNWLIFYNLACYACQLGRPADATKLLKRSLRIGDAQEIRAMAMEDSDLQSLRQSIEKL